MKSKLSKAIVAATLLTSIPTLTNAQYQPYYPTYQQIVKRYQDNYLLDSITKNKVLNSNINVHWNPNDNSYCWYAKEIQPQIFEYIIVDTKNGKKIKAFDMDKLLHSIPSDTIITSKDISQVFINKKDDNILFVWNKQQYSYLPNFNKITLLGKAPLEKPVNPYGKTDFKDRWSRWGSFATDTISPDKKWSATIRNGNIFILNNLTKTEKQYTTNGTDANFYGSLAWSPDSKTLITYHVRPVIDSNVYFVLSSVPGTTRGVLKSNPYKQPGDPFTTYEMFVIKPQEEKITKVKTDIIDFFDAPEIHWEKDNQYFSYERVDRGHQRFRIVGVNTNSGDTTNIVDEKTKTFIYENRLISYYLPESKEIIRSSEKDGWQHLYLVNTATKKEQLITKGNWIVRDVDSVDTQKREIWFSASGLYPTEDPYNIHFCRIKFDGTGLLDLTPENGNHKVRFSPDKKYLIDRYSRVNVAPISKLKSVITGKNFTTLEIADTSALVTIGTSLIEPFVAKGRDGKTDIYGVICKPSHMDPNTKYPVIENIYAGPQDAFVPKDYLPYSEMQSIAELGFIVVQIDGMGTANRSKTFHDVCWHNIQDAGFPDRILWIKALAEKYPFVDTARVGLYGTSAGGQDAMGGLLSHPEFYKAAVAACGCHDNRIDKQWWNEQWMGYPVGPWYAEQSNVTNAHKLKGALMLIVGDADENVPPETTYRVADALIHAGKSFDFLPIPGSNHTDGGPYGRARKKDFFVKNLLKVTPPDRNDNDDFPLPKTGIR
ncbi:S9 family peptidase [Rhizosphaericola mali]|uniref:Prolyl oligopeptidase family serine peptidase n=1 Tax=Rhizosphaericola mali TaxID=2545455 RepID=A0A5P2G1Q7_9BACT|nr:S9 family peptidase [Rhizosphaericola mali]QES89107.1 prolyl oligopeptidase family serine peptidase [Rhizosphaericola mali]